MTAYGIKAKGLRIETKPLGFWKSAGRALGDVGSTVIQWLKVKLGWRFR